MSLIVSPLIDAKTLQGKTPTDFALAGHNHNSVYYTETEADAKFATKEDMANAGLGDMLKSVYDTNADGKVNSADKADKLATTITINGVSFDGSTNITIADSTKEPAITAGSTTQYFRGDKTWQTLNKSAVGLGNVDNTADTSKSVLSATKLTTARTINGVSFDGSTNITITADPNTHTHTKSQITDFPSIPTKTSQLTNDSGFLTAIPTATAAVLGGVKQGANITIAGDGTISTSLTYNVKEEEFAISGGQTIFDLTKGSYIVGSGSLQVYVDGQPMANKIITELTTTRFSIPSGFPDGSVVRARYVTSAVGNPVQTTHGSTHITGGTDPIPLATTSQDGLMPKGDLTTLRSLNSTLLNKLTDASGRLQYNGADISPSNLTTNMVKLGGKYTVQYNSTEDSLDFIYG